jgi:hypothetical protein
MKQVYEREKAVACCADTDNNIFLLLLNDKKALKFPGSRLHRAHHTPRQSHSPWFDNPNDIQVTVQITELSLRDFLQPPVTPSLLGPNTLLSALFTNTLNPHSSLNVKDRVSCPHKTAKIILSYILFSYVVLSCVGAEPATSRQLVQGVLPHVVKPFRKPFGWGKRHIHKKHSWQKQCIL